MTDAPDHPTPAEQAEGRRRHRVRPSPVSMRFPPHKLEGYHARAAKAGMALSAFVMATLDNTPGPGARRSRAPVVDGEALGVLMAHVGKLGSNVNQLAHVANCGSWPDRHALELALADLQWMRDMVMLALGIDPPGNDNTPAGVRPPPSLQR